MPILSKQNRLISILVGVAVATSTILSLSFGLLPSPSSLWDQLGVSETAGRENIKRSFLEGVCYTYGAAAARKILPMDRPLVVTALLSYTREYTMGTAFEKEYAMTREASKPARPDAMKMKSEIQQERIEELTKAISEMEKSRQNLPKELIAEFSEAAQMLIDQRKDFENPNSEMLILLSDAELFNHQVAVERYEGNLDAWKKEFPDDHRQMIKVRLKEFLDVTETVDFSASLRDENGVKKFVNPAYERKSKEWKLAFRCGRSVVETAQTFAREWLLELE